MSTIETSIAINQSPEKVFAFLTHLQNQKALNPSITDVSWTAPSPSAPATRLR